MRMPEKGLYAITDYDRLSHAVILGKSREILRAGTALLQFRNKKDKAVKLIQQARDLRILCRDFNVPFIVNDNLELALTIDADGIHIGEEDINYDEARRQLGNHKIIGISCYNDFKRATLAASSGADYIAFGAFFPTYSKKKTVRAKMTLLKEARGLNLPLVAIGGITPENGRSLLDAGADFLAVISGLYQAENSYNAARSYIKLFN